MIRRYMLVLEVPRSGFWTSHRIGCFGTVERALRAAERVLAKHPTVETRANDAQGKVIR